MRKANYSDLQLTHRELQILQLIAHGYSAKEVAQQIHIAPRTVEGHIDTIRLKLQARNRAHMVAKAMAAQLVAMEMLSLAVPVPAQNGHGANFYAGEVAGIAGAGQPIMQLVSGAPVAEPGNIAWSRPG